MTTTHEVNQDAVSTKHQEQPPKRYVGISLLLLITVGCIASAVYFVSQWRQATTQQLQLVLAKVAAINAQQTHTTTQLDSTIHHVNINQDKLNLLGKQVHTRLQQQIYKTDDWALLKARYFLELAQINAYWTDNTQTTSALLSQADTLLENTHEQRLFDVRRVIAEEKAQVDAVEKIDVVGILSQLDAAQQLTSHLLIHQVIALTGDKSVPMPASKEVSLWRERLSSSLTALEKLVVVRRVEEDVQPLTTPAYAALLRETIQLMLQEAQLAVLRGNESFYQLVLKQATTKVTQSFDPRDVTTEALLKQLKLLRKTTLIQKKVDIGQSLLLLNQVIEAKPEVEPVGEKSS